MDTEILIEMEAFFTALADKTRLRLLNLMRDGEVCVCFFTEVLGESQPKISRHLAYLRNAGMIEARRDGKWMHYRIMEPQSPSAAKVLQDILLWLELQQEMQDDYKKLSLAYLSPSATVTITRAPKPNIYVEANVRSSDTSVKQEIETFLL